MVLASNFWTMRNWDERTGVHDDICYLRQAHLFQRFGLDGFNTDTSRDDDKYFATLAREIDYADWANPKLFPCHASYGTKRVLQYPPGTGLALAIFPDGFQRVPLYVVANLVVFVAALLAIWSAPSRRWIAFSGVVSAVALYFMINPAKSSFSMAPTIIVCAIVGFLTAGPMNAQRQWHRMMAVALAGLLLGLSVSIRLPNLFLSAGYFVVFLAMVLRERQARDIARLMMFGAAYLLGLIPTFVSNAVNTGNPFKSAYSSLNLPSLDFSFSVVPEYMADLQGPVILFTIAWTIWALVNGNRTAIIVAVNLVVNLLFFLTYAIFTTYYLMPLASLACWTLLFSGIRSAETDSTMAGYRTRALASA